MSEAPLTLHMVRCCVGGSFAATCSMKPLLLALAGASTFRDTLWEGCRNQTMLQRHLPNVIYHRDCYCMKRTDIFLPRTRPPVHQSLLIRNLMRLCRTSTPFPYWYHTLNSAPFISHVVLWYKQWFLWWRSRWNSPPTVRGQHMPTPGPLSSLMF